MYVLGISAFYHDSAAALIQDGEIIAAAQEERFTRRKHDHRFPTSAIQYCLAEAGITPGELTAAVFYEKPLLKFDRLLETYLAYAPKGFQSFLMAMQLWLKEKLNIHNIIKKELGRDIRVLFTEHHESHMAAAFYPSPFPEAAILTLDGVGEWATTALGYGRGEQLEILSELRFPHSLGLLYSAFTYYTGFKVNSGEYKVMGLAPYGEPKYVSTILDHLIDLKDDGSFRLNMDYFNYPAGLTMTNERFHRLFGGPPRQPETKLTQREMDLARSIQTVTEEIVLRLARTAHRQTGMKNLCLAGGVALNCVANGRLLREGPFVDLWIQPAAGDAGSALGAALAVWYRHFNGKRDVNGQMDAQKGSYLGPSFSNEQIEAFLTERQLPYSRLGDAELVQRVAQLLSAGAVVGWFQGRMEFGPRALGARSILGDPMSPSMQATMNLKIKFRESFRPFAPSVLAEHVSDYFELDRPSPYMLLVADVTHHRRRQMTAAEQGLWGIDKLNVVRSDIPAVTHVDYSARIQTVHKETNPRYHALLQAFYQRTGCPVLVNTSFNVRGEPIVCSPEDAYRCFMRTNMDYLVLENCVLSKEDQPPLQEETDWRSQFDLD